MCLLLLASVNAAAAPALSAGTDVRGRDDQPRVLFIVPWQTPESRVKSGTGSAPMPVERLKPVTAEALSAHRQFRRTLDLQRKPVTLE